MTKQVQHTPAPWLACPSIGQVRTNFVAKDHGSFIIETHPDRMADGSQYAANLNLIAAAPELLAACEQAAGELRSVKQAASMSDSTPEIDRNTLNTLLSVLDEVTNKARGSK